MNFCQSRGGGRNQKVVWYVYVCICVFESVSIYMCVCVLMCVCSIREILLMGNKNKNINSEKQTILISHWAPSSGFSPDLTKNEI